MAQVKIEGRTIEIEDAIAQDDQKLLEVVSSFYPGAKNSTVTRNQNHISIVRKAGTKGNLKVTLKNLQEVGAEESEILDYLYTLKQQQLEGSLRVEELIKEQETIQELINQQELEELKVAKTAEKIARLKAESSSLLIV